MALTCPACKTAMHHSRARSWFERLRRLVTRQALFRCRSCGWRGWRDEPSERLAGPREIHRALTDAELERLEPDNFEGERM